MGLFSSKILFKQDCPAKLSDFKALDCAPEQYEIPEIGSKRVSTDRGFFVGFIVCGIFLCLLLIYTGIYYDSERWELGFDTCGNVCGLKNEPYEGISCTGKDMREKKYLIFEGMDVVWDLSHFDAYPRHCGHTCEIANNTLYLFSSIITEHERKNWCYFSNNLIGKFSIEDGNLVSVPVSNNFHLGKFFGHTVLVSCIALILCAITVMLFRYAIEVVVWGIIGISYSLLCIFTLCSLTWLSDFYSGEDKIIIGIFWICVTFLLIVSFKRIPLVINLFREARKAIFAMPGVFIVSLAAFVSTFIVLILFLLTMVLFSNSGILTELREDMYSYYPNGMMIFGLFFDIFLTIWILYFIKGVQIMVTAGAVSSWYFSRDKQFLGRPVSDAFHNMFKHHLGSVAFGSLLITIATIIKCIIKIMMKNKRTKWLAEMILGCMETLLLFVTRNAYILTAMHGEPFTKSGKRAVQLIFHNINDILAINSIGDFVLFMAKVIIVLITSLIAQSVYGFDKDVSASTALICGLILTIILTNLIFNTFNIVIDTIYLCYCEDCCLNDGIERPYYMSVELMQYFDESKKILAAK